jgi:ABC-type lipoprotein export system ATPase subunit
MTLLEKMNKKRKSTFVFVSHDMNIARYGKRTIILKDGKVIGDTDVDHETFEEISKKLGENGSDGGGKR